MHLTQNSQVVAVEGNVLTLGFTNVGARDSFVNGGCDEILRQAAIDVAGVDWQVESIVDPGATGGPSAALAFPPRRRPPRPPPADDGQPAAEAAPAAPPDPTQPTAGGRPTPSPAPTTTTPTPRRSDLAGAALLERELGAQVIEEIPRS